VIVITSPGAYEVLSIAKVKPSSLALAPPTRTETAAALTPVVAVADDFVPTVMLAVPSATPVRLIRKPAPSVQFFESYVREPVVE
jgi:hypothetical protein